MAFTNPITLGHKNLSEKAFTFATDIASGLSSQDAMDAGAAFRLLSNNITTSSVSNSKFDVFFTWTPTQQVDWLSSGAIGSLGLGQIVYTSSFPYGFWTADHTTAALALPAENGLTQKARRSALMRMIWGTPHLVDPTTGTTLKNIWDSLTVGLTYAEKLLILTAGSPTPQQSSTSSVHVANNLILDDIQLIISDIATNATGLSTRMMLLNYFIAITTRNEMHFAAFMTDSNLLANLLAANADAKKAFFTFLTQGSVTSTNILYNINSITKANPTAYINLLAKCTTVTKAANDTTSAITNAPSGKCILIKCSASTTIAGVTIAIGGYINMSATFSKESLSTTFSYNGTMPTLSTTSVVPRDTNPWACFYAPYFTQNSSATDTLSMSFLDCGA